MITAAGIIKDTGDLVCVIVVIGAVLIGIIGTIRGDFW